MKIKTPPSWRKGQTIFNFLEWIAQTQKSVSSQSVRMADPFYIYDEELDKLFKEFLKEHE